MTPFLAEADLPPCARLNARTPQPGESGGLVQEEEDRMLAEAIAKSASDASKKDS